ncbi:hypothetical protein M431DRAFT_18555 [Trichoderma harzianum CBS 226.95]|uniref:NWD NACHT-NTPase N-terminal domain-containing protein n=1 Tax=Trichoderma harzianum CBS 226.95 TaxID=983964 RepID=A0A2T4A523_TRIHA|nr:hypothetical protein M431DRAFT_18555 [Trichoderma harzianum CBS 226.95]PTB52170.1 hypothetical protein M431DRAFT_18555 [Trichoderma harzianum CBS 226.95]
MATATTTQTTDLSGAQCTTLTYIGHIKEAGLSSYWTEFSPVPTQASDESDWELSYIAKPTVRHESSDSGPLDINSDCRTTGLESETSDHSEKCKPSLWDRAYDSLKKTDGQLVEDYEKLLSMEFQTNTVKPIGPHDNLHELLITAENRINSTNHNEGLKQLETITTRGLEQLENRRTKYTIFGHEFTLRNQVAHATQFIQKPRNAIHEAVKVPPYTYLAWAGFCLILPTFMNPDIAEEASRDGHLYVTSRMQFYVKLESLLLPSDRLQASGLSAELEDRLIELYRQIIEFRLKVVRRVYLTRLVRFKEDAVQHEDWKGMVAKIRESEKILSDDAKQANDAAMGRELEKISNNAERFYTDITSILAPLLRDSRKTSAVTFMNNGSGSQYNATTGGVQNIAKGNRTNFSGVTFTGAVNIN